MGLGDFISGIFGSKNKERIDLNDERLQVDPNAYQYGGAPGGADEAANRYRQQAERAQKRQGVQTDYAGANRWEQQNINSRTAQEQTANIMFRRATGQTPSIARMAADRQMGQAIAAQRAQAASARGPAGLALAGRTAAGNIANAQSAIANQAQINEANEQLAAEQAAFGALSNMRAGDISSQQQAAQQAQYQAGLSAQQRALNDQFSLGMTGFEHGVRQTQLGAQMQQQAQQSANTVGAAGINAGVGGQNAAMNQANAMGALNMGASVGVGVATGGGGGVPKKAEGGPVAANRPYIVGEEGPEIIIPQQAGTVIPAEETAAVLSTWGTGEDHPVTQRGAQWAAKLDAERGRGLVRMANETESPWARDVRQVRTLRQVAPHLVSEEDDERERRGLLVMRQAAKDKPKGESKEAPKKDDAPKAMTGRDRAVGALGTVADQSGKIASSIDTRYHGPSSGYVPPPMVVLPSPRAAGGPMAPGNPYMVGEQGPELVLPAGILGMQRKASAPAMSGPASESFAGQSGMLGGSPIGELRAHSAFATRFAKDPTAQPRERGGKIEPGKKYLVGEKGPELVLREELDRAELGEIQRSRPQPTSESFRFDTPEERARIKAATLAAASRDADAMLAGYKRSLKEGASVAPVVEIDKEPAPWLAAFMAAQESPSVLVAPYGGAREDGGKVEPGKAYLVGEKGKEIIATLGSFGPNALVADLIARREAEENTIDENSSKPLAEGPSARVRALSRMKSERPASSWTYAPQVKR